MGVDRPDQTLRESHAEPVLLTETLLEDLERAIEPHAPGYCAGLPAGLAAGHIHELTEPLGLRLPTEAQTLWAWHDGYAELIFGWKHPPLALQVEHYRRCRAVAEERAKDLGANAPELGDPELWWPRSWFPIAEPSRTDETSVDCRTADGEPSPIWEIDWTDPEPGGPPFPTWESLGHLFATWIDLLHAGEFIYNGTSGWQPRERQRWGHWGYLHPGAIPR